MEQVAKMLDAGVGFATAVKECLLQLPVPLTLEAFAEKYELNTSTVSAAINGAVRPSEGVVSALSGELGGSPFAWRYEMWKAAEPRPMGGSEPSRQMVEA